jgi:hypothetical protein
VPLFGAEKTARRSASPLDAVDLRLRSTLLDRFLPRLAVACLSASMVFLCAFVVLVALAATQLRLTPSVVLAALVITGAFVVSGRALSTLARRSTPDEPRLWKLSLLANIVVVATTASVIGVQPAVVVCIPELAGVAIHVIALVALPVPQPASNNRWRGP